MKIMVEMNETQFDLYRKLIVDESYTAEDAAQLFIKKAESSNNRNGMFGSMGDPLGRNYMQSEYEFRSGKYILRVKE